MCAGVGTEAYPQLFSLADILTAWNPDNITIPLTAHQYSSLREFNYQVRARRCAAIVSVRVCVDSLAAFAGH